MPLVWSIKPTRFHVNAADHLSLCLKLQHVSALIQIRILIKAVLVYRVQVLEMEQERLI